MIVEYRRGRGCVFHVGCTEWVVGLQPREAADHHAEGPVKSEAVERITKTVLNRFLDSTPLPDLEPDDGMGIGGGPPHAPAARL